MSKKLGNLLRILLCLSLMVAYFGWAVPQAGATGETPVVIRVSEGIAPGKLVSLYGEYMTGDTAVKFVKKDGSVAAIQDAYQADPKGQFCRVVFPEATAGVYALYIQNADGWSQDPVYVNKADPRWLSEERSYPGLEMKLMGRNLDAAEYGGTTDTQIRLIPTGGGDPVVLPSGNIGDVTPYCVDFTMPTDISLGTYYVEVRTNSAEYGADWVRLTDASECPVTPTDTVLTVESAPADPTALALGVTWAKDLNWTNVVNVRTDFGAVGDGIADDTVPLQNAINSVSNSGGGVVYIPNGTYNFSFLFFHKDVILKGESNTGAILQFTRTNPGHQVGAIQASGSMSDPNSAARIGRQGICNLKIVTKSDLDPALDMFLLYLGGPSLNIDDYTASKIFIYNNNIELGYCAKYRFLYIQAGGPVLFLNNTYNGPNPMGGQMVKKYFTLKDNTFDYPEGQISASSNRLLVEGNTLTGHYTGGLTTNIHGLFVGESIMGFNVWNKYIANNIIQDMEEPIGHGGEGIALDSPGYKMTGYITNSTANTVDVFETYLCETVGHYSNWDKEWQVLIVSGKGMGQLRKMTAREDLGVTNPWKKYRFTVSPAWDILPDATSKAAIVRCQAGVIEGNTITDCNGPAVDIYNGCFDCVAADNTGVNTMGIMLDGAFLTGRVYNLIRAYPDLFNQVKRNNLSGKSSFWNTTWIGERAQDDSQYGFWAPCHYGNEIRDNTVDRSGSENNWDFCTSIPACYSQFMILNPRAGDCILASLYEGNTAKNCKYGISIFQPFSSKTVVRGMTYEGISASEVFGRGRDVLIAEPSSAPVPLPDPDPGINRAPEATVTVRGEESPIYAKGNLNNNFIYDYWCDSGLNPTSWVQFQFPGDKAYVITEYVIAQNGRNSQAFENDPKDWEFKGSNDGINWTVLDTQNDQDFPDRRQKKSYKFSNSTAYKYYKFDSITNHGIDWWGRNALSVGEIELIDHSDSASLVTNIHLTGTPRNDTTFNGGMMIAVGDRDITVSKLGRYYVAGNSGIHTLKIIKDSGNTEVASVDIDMSQGTADALGFKYVELSSPVTLYAYESYYIVSSEMAGGDQWYYVWMTADNSAANLCDVIKQSYESRYRENSPGLYCYTGLNFIYTK